MEAFSMEQHLLHLAIELETIRETLDYIILFWITFQVWCKFFNVDQTWQIWCLHWVLDFVVALCTVAGNSCMNCIVAVLVMVTMAAVGILNTVGRVAVGNFC